MNYMQSLIKQITDRPVVFFDLETTGVDPVQDRIVQMSLVKVSPGGALTEYNTMVNPTIPIPAQATEIHGITNSQVENFLPFRGIATEVVDFLKGCDLAGYNILIFDLPLLLEELGRVNLDLDLTGVRLIDVCLMYRKLRPRTLLAAFKDYVGLEMEDAHNARADVMATIAVLHGMINRDKDQIGDSPGAWMDFVIDRKNMVDLAGKFVWDAAGDMRFTFGVQKGNLVAENFGMLKWMVGKGFPRETMKWVDAILNDTSLTHRSVSPASEPESLPFG